MTGSCPKHMVLGPCGGVRADGGCEVVPDPCVFPVPAQWADSSVPPVPLRAVPLILTDFSSEPYSVRMLRAVARTLGVAGLNISGAASAVLAVADTRKMPEPPRGWRDRAAAVERELRRRFGSTPQLSAATEQSDRIGRLLGSGQLTSQVIMLCPG